MATSPTSRAAAPAAAPGTAGAAPLPPARIAAMIITQLLLCAVIAATFVGLYIGLSRQPTPHQLPIATVSGPLAQAAESAWGSMVSLQMAADPAQARQLVLDHQAVAAFLPTSDGGVQLLTAGADGLSATTAATALVSGLAQQAGLPLSTTDLIPRSTYDRQGLAGFYLVFGVTLACFFLAQVLMALSAQIGLRLRMATAAVGGVVVAAVAYTLAGPVMGAIPAPALVAVPVLALLGAAVALATMAVAALVGPMGNVISTLVFTTLGNATSGATVSEHLMPSTLAHLGSVLPQGAAIRVITDAGYFGGQGAAWSVTVLAIWTAAAATILAARALRTTPAHTDPAPPTSSSGSHPEAIGAAGATGATGATDGSASKPRTGGTGAAAQIRA